MRLLVATVLTLVMVVRRHLPVLLRPRQLAMVLFLNELTQALQNSDGLKITGMPGFLNRVQTSKAFLESLVIGTVW